MTSGLCHDAVPFELHLGKMKRSPHLRLNEVWLSSNADRGGRVNFTLASDGRPHPPLQRHACAPKARKTVDNYQVKLPGSRTSTAQHVGVTEPIFARGQGTRLLC